MQTGILYKIWQWHHEWRLISAAVAASFSRNQAFLLSLLRDWRGLSEVTIVSQKNKHSVEVHGPRNASFIVCRYCKERPRQPHYWSCVLRVIVSQGGWRHSRTKTQKIQSAWPSHGGYVYFSLNARLNITAFYSFIKPYTICIFVSISSFIITSVFWTGIDTDSWYFYPVHGALNVVYRLYMGLVRR